MAKTPSAALPVGTPAIDFTLPDTRNNLPVTLSDEAGKPIVIAFICNHCPYVVHILDAFVNLAHEVADQGVSTFAISANDIVAYPEDGPLEMAALAERKHFDFPYLFDEEQSVARAYEAACTPDIYLYDSDHRLYYHGRFDETRPGGAPAHGRDLRAAIDALLAGDDAPPASLPSVGCSIKWRSN